jgi:hypothetical protein
MNRIKFWVFTLLVVAAGYLLAHTASTARRADAIAALDARLASAAAHVAAATGSAGREASSVAALAARDEALVSALHPVAAPPPAPPPPPKGKGKRAPPPPPPPPRVDPAAQDAAAQAAAKAALAKAEKALGFDLPLGTQVLAASQASLVRKSDETEVGALLRAAAGNQPRRAIVRHGGALFAAAARPAGEGAGIVVLVPLDEAWARRLATAAGVDLTLAVAEVKPVSTAKGADPVVLQGATKLAGAGDVGRPAEVELALGPVKLPKLPQPIAGGAPLRARAVPLEGLKAGYVVASIAAAPTVNPPAVFLWWSLLGLALVLLVGVVVGFFVRATEPTPQVPDALLAAAARIEKGEFAARAPVLAGKFGTLAAALNRAAEIAGPALAARGAPQAPATTDEWFAAGLSPRAPDAAARAPTVMTTPAAPPRGGTVAAVAAPVAAAGIEVDEETHWQQVFQDFLRTRTACGEPAEGLTYDRFRQKLEGNKAQLVSKYGCKTVRFQVYVKDGKAALKATPVK